MSSEDWRIEDTAETYFSHRQRRAAIEQRRPVIRTAVDLVGPGINANSIRVTNWDDTLATFNGYYASTPGALNVPVDNEAFLGEVNSDSELGGRQILTSIVTNTTYSRVFLRNPTDPDAISFGSWKNESDPGIDFDALRPIGEVTIWWGSPTQPPVGWLLAAGGTFNGSMYPKLLTHLGSTNIPDFRLVFPVGAEQFSLPQGQRGGSNEQSISLPDHRHSIAGQTGARTDQNRGPGSAAGVLTLVSDYQNHNHGGWSGMSGEATRTWDNRPSFLAVYFIIRAGLPAV